MSQRRVPLLVFNPHAIYASNCSKVFEPVGQSTLWSSHLVKLRLGILWIKLQSYWSAYPRCPEGIGFSLIIKCCTTVNHCKSKFACFVKHTRWVNVLPCTSRSPENTKKPGLSAPKQPFTAFCFAVTPIPSQFPPAVGSGSHWVLVQGLEVAYLSEKQL